MEEQSTTERFSTTDKASERDASMDEATRSSISVCNCCHCKALRNADKRARFLQTKEGQRRLNMKLAAKDFFMDFMAMSKVRQQVHESIHGGKANDKQLARRRSFPVSIANATRFTDGTLMLKWWVHDDEGVERYMIYIDGKLAKTILDPKSEKTYIAGFDVMRCHKIRMKAIPKKEPTDEERKMDLWVKEFCASGTRPRSLEERLCDCTEQSDDPLNSKNATIKDQFSLSQYWRESVYMYFPPLKEVPTSESIEENVDCPCDSFKK